jgi:hypothetical protein
VKILHILIAYLCVASTTAFASPLPPKVVKATDGVFAAFQSHPLVGIGEWHGLAQELDFYAALVRDPRFAVEVGNIVLETGDAAQQSVADRYVNGENVPYTELRKVWSDTVGWFPTVQALGSINLYATVRAINQALPPEKRIKVWLGDPPIDWSQIKTNSDWLPLQAQRDDYPSELIKREILSKNKKALVIYGGAHLGVYPGGMALFPDLRHPNLRARLDAARPGALYVVSPYVGYTTTACGEEFAKSHLVGVSAPSLIFPIRGSSLNEDLLRPGCTPFSKSADEPQEEFEIGVSNFVGLHSDALLYLGPRGLLLTSPNAPDSYLDLDYRAELDRRMRLRMGNGLKAPDPINNPATPRPYELQ